MLHTLSQKIAVFLFDEKDSYPMEVYIYGIELVVSSLIGICIVLTAGILTGYLIESLIFMAGLSAIRFFSGGYHADTYLKCNTIYLISYVFAMLIYLFLLLQNESVIFLISTVIFVTTCITLTAFAPVENKNKEIEDSQKGKFKVISIVLFSAEFIIAAIFYYYGLKQVLILLPAILIVDISILVEIILQKRRNTDDKVEKAG